MTIFKSSCPVFDVTYISQEVGGWGGMSVKTPQVRWFNLALNASNELVYIDPAKRECPVLEIVEVKPYEVVTGTGRGNWVGEY